MYPEPLLAPFAKIEWAKAEIDSLNAALREFFASNPYERRSYLNADRTQEIWYFKLTKKLLPIFSIRAGNILKNLREPLDNMTAALSDLHRGTQTGISFPFGRDIKEYEADAQKLEKLLPPGAATLIRAARTHPGGNKHLRALHYLNRNDKHRVGLVPINLMSAITQSAFIIFSGQVIRVGFEHGSRLIPDRGNNLVAPSLESGPIIVRNGVIIRGSDGQPACLFTPDLGAGDNDMEFLAVSRGSQFHCDAKPVLDVAFRDVPGLEREPAILALNEMRQLIESILLTFRNRFFP